MSRVYFHTQSDTAELRGSERAWAGGVVETIAVGLIEPKWKEQEDFLLTLIKPDHYLHTMPREGFPDAMRWQRSFDVAWRNAMGDDFLTWRGEPLPAWDISLNTALVVGNDQVKFLARMHAQCEIHGWVDGPDRGWLADLMQQGRDTGLYRPEQGWEDVIALLRRRDDEPVVMSYSVCDQFPNPYASDWMPAWPDGKPQKWDALSEAEQEERSAREEAWYDLPDAEKWERGLRWLRTQPGLGALRPDDWQTFRFGRGITVFDLLAPDHAERLDQALGLVTA